MNVTLVLDPPFAMTGLCGDATFPGSARRARIVCARARGHLAQLPLVDREVAGRNKARATAARVTSETPMPIQTDHGR